ncbi:MAG: polysaccharide deacetylase family protein [Bacteroidota bacterium]
MKYAVLFVASLLSFALSAQQTIQEKLGYPKNTKLLIIHADDIGVSHSENTASINALEKGSVSSGSIMVPCPWMPEIAAYAKAHPNADLGLHLTLTAEWNIYKWGPVLPRTEVPSLVDGKGFLFDNTGDVAKAKVADIEKELRAQVERAKQFGIDPTHFDTHMGSVFTSVDVAKVYVKLGHEYKVPVLMGALAAKMYLNADVKDLGAENDVLVDNLIMAQPEDFKGGMKAFYTKSFKAIQPGLNVLLLHAAHNDDEMKAVTAGHPEYGAEWRQADYDFFTSEECKKLLLENNIRVVTWKEIRDKVVRK